MKKNTFKSSIFLLIAGLFVPVQLIQCSDGAELLEQKVSAMGKEIMGEGARWFFRPRSFQEGTLTSTIAMAGLLTASHWASEKRHGNHPLSTSIVYDGIEGTTFVLGAACGLCAYYGAGPFDLPALAPTIAKNLPCFVAGSIGLLSLGSFVRHSIRYIRGK